MSRTMSMIIAVFMFALTVPSSRALAQEGPPPPEGGQRVRPPRPPNDPPPPDGADLQPTFRGEVIRFDLMRGYLDLVDRIARLSRDPTTSGVAAVISAADLLKARGADAGIEYFTQLLETPKNDAVERAIRIQLIELYKQSGQHEKALEQLTELINGAPTGPVRAEREQQVPPPPPGR